MKYLHVAIIEDFEECFISYSESGLREQITGFLTDNKIAPPTDEEWKVCILAEVDLDIPITTIAVGLISYYRVESQLDGSVERRSA